MKPKIHRKKYVNFIAPSTRHGHLKRFFVESLYHFEIFTFFKIYVDQAAKSCFYLCFFGGGFIGFSGSGSSVLKSLIILHVHEINARLPGAHLPEVICKVYQNGLSLLPEGIVCFARRDCMFCPKGLSHLVHTIFEKIRIGWHEY